MFTINIYRIMLHGLANKHMKLQKNNNNNNKGTRVQIQIFKKWHTILNYIHAQDKEFLKLFRDSLLEICRQKNLTAFNKLKFITLKWQVTILFSSLSHTCIDNKSANTNWSYIDKLPFCSVQKGHTRFLNHFSLHIWKKPVYNCLLHIQVWYKTTNTDCQPEII